MNAPRIPRRDADYWPALGLLLTFGPGLIAIVGFIVMVAG